MAKINEINKGATLYQVSTTQAISAGYFYGVTTVGELMKHGDTGIGTFEGGNGEMAVIDGVCYQALADGSVRIADNNEPVPHAAVAYFKQDMEEELPSADTCTELINHLDELIKQGRNMFWLCEMKAELSHIQVRAVHKQYPPYCEIGEVMRKDRVVHEYDDISGTLVAMYCPPYASGVNVAGWHIHFISADKSKGGHVEALTLRGASARLCMASSVEIHLPSDDFFNSLDLSSQEEALRKVELA